jgi:hypothetical protein
MIAEVPRRQGRTWSTARRGAVEIVAENAAQAQVLLQPAPEKFDISTAAVALFIDQHLFFISVNSDRRDKDKMHRQVS